MTRFCAAIGFVLTTQCQPHAVLFATDRPRCSASDPKRIKPPPPVPIVRETKR